MSEQTENNQIREIDNRMRGIETTLAVTRQKLEDTEKETLMFRGRMEHHMTATNIRLDKMLVEQGNLSLQIAKLPCPQREGRGSSITKQVNIIWGVLVILLGAIIAEWVKRGK